MPLTGIPSSGKTTVTREVRRRTSTFRVIDGDREVRRMCPDPTRRLDEAQSLFQRLLGKIDEQSASHNVIVDMTLPESYVVAARERFGEALFVSLRVTEDDRQRREVGRRDRSPVMWDAQKTALQGPKDLYDLVVGASRMEPRECALAILSKAARHWDGIQL
jgi:gluconate kinase